MFCQTTPHKMSTTTTTKCTTKYIAVAYIYNFIKNVRSYATRRYLHHFYVFCFKKGYWRIIDESLECHYISQNFSLWKEVRSLLFNFTQTIPSSAVVISCWAFYNLQAHQSTTCIITSMCENTWYHTDEFIINVPTFTLHLLGMRFFFLSRLKLPFC